MNTNFPDHLFEIQNPALYLKNLSNGKEIASKKSIIFCGIARDCEDVISLNIERVNHTGHYFNNYHTFIYESNSSDNTPNILNNLGVNFKSGTNKQDYNKETDFNHYNRCKVLAECRSEYHDYVHSNPHYDYVCVIDFDLMGGWSYSGFLHSLSILEDKVENACVSAYGLLADEHNTRYLEDVSSYLMYDSFAFRSIAGVSHLSNVGLSIFNFIKPDVGANPILVNSNFNGLAIYKTSFFLKSKYGAELVNENFVNCDHVVFHRGIIENSGRVIMNPSLLTSYSKHRFCDE